MYHSLQARISLGVRNKGLTPKGDFNPPQPSEERVFQRRRGPKIWPLACHVCKLSAPFSIFCLGKQTMARFILETDNPSGRTWARIFSSSDNPSVYKYGQRTDYPSRPAICLVRLGRRTKVDNPSVCINVGTDELRCQNQHLVT